VSAELGQHGARKEIQQLCAQDFVRVEHLSAEEAAQARQIAKQIASSPSTKVRNHTRHIPEAKAIVLMQRPNLQAARQIANALNIPVTGFIGVLLLACADGYLSPKEMADLLESCRRQGTRYSNLLVAEAVKKCLETSTQ
jgi:predicted nucleic acid-binding protein